MNTRLHRMLAVLTVLGALGGVPADAYAQQQDQRRNRFVTVERAIETEAGAIILPSTPGGTLVTSLCSGCPPKSLRATASTQYFLGDRQVTLAELTAAVAGRPETFMTVSFLVETDELTRVSASVDATPAAKAR
mgnify:CR=1 FL=1